MYKELCVHKNDILIEDVQKRILSAISRGVHGISVLPYFLPHIVEIIPSGLTLTVPIDYPFGTSTTRLRQHASIAALRKGANTIDLVLNTLDIINNKFDKIETDLISHTKICKERNSSLRIIFEYRILTKEKLYKVCRMVKLYKVEYVLPSTGFMVDECTDNLITSLELQKKFGFKVITNGNLWLQSQYDTIQKSTVFGVRLNNKNCNLIYNGVL